MPRRRVKKRQPGTKLMKKVATQQAKKVVAREVETKFWDGTLLANGADNAVSATGFNMYLTSDYASGILTPIALQSGVVQTSYLGQVINPVALEMRYLIDIDQTITGDAHNSVTLLLWQAKGSFIASNVSASSQFQSINNVTAPLSPINLNFDDRMRIIKRKMITVDQDDPSKSGSIFLSRKHLRKIKFSDGIGTLETNPLVLTLISDSTASEHPNIRIHWRLHFKDA